MAVDHPNNEPLKRDLLIVALLVVSAVSIRLYHIQGPILDRQAWRQATDALMAEYYYLYGYSKLFEPKVRGVTPDPQPFINEFPLYPYVISLFYAASGPSPVWGRALSILATALGVVWMYQLVLAVDRRRTVAVCAALFLNFAPLLVYFGRAHQRHAWVLALMIGCLREFVVYLSNKRSGPFLRCGLYGSLAILMNPPAAYIGIPMGYFALRNRSTSVLGRVDLWALVLALLLPSAVWYAYAVSVGENVSILPLGRPYFRDFGNPAYYVRWISVDFFSEIFERVYKQVLTLAPLVLFILGLGSYRRGDKLPFVWLLSVLVYFALDVWFVVIHVHEYYYLNTIPPVAWLAGRGFDWAAHWLSILFPRKARLAWGVLVVSIAGSYAYRIAGYADWFQPDVHLVEILTTINERTPPGSVVAVDNLNDAIPLNAERPTYRVGADFLSVQGIENLLANARQGMTPTHLLLTRNLYLPKGSDTLKEFEGRYPISYSDEDYILYSLSDARKSEAGP